MDNDGFVVESETTFSSDSEQAPVVDQQSVYIDLDDIKDKQPPVDEKPDAKLDKPALSVGLMSVELPTSAPPRPDKPYADMNKEDLLRFSDTPFWNRFRLISILIFWAAWLGLLAAVIALTIVAPRCDDQPTPIWWQKSVIYQIYVRSFYDVDGDGVGDIKGVTAKLPYLKDLQVDTILLSSVFQSNKGPLSDYGYEITNYTEIDETYGTADDLRQLIDAAHNESMYVLVDFVPNFTGLEHEWFQQSKSNRSYTNPYWNYYVWAECSESSPPNNWLSVYGEHAWKYDQTRKQCYLHQFLETQPELNLRSSGVQEHLEQILRFWLDFGIDGFRVTNTAYLYENTDLHNETEISSCNSTNLYDCQSHEKTSALPESYEIVARWREIIEEYNKNAEEKYQNNDDEDPKNPYKVLITDADLEPSRATRYYGNENGLNGANLAINYGLTDFRSSDFGGKLINDTVTSWMDSLPADATANWLTGNQDHSRLTSYVGDGRLYKAVQMIRMTLPGAAFVYYGEEIGMTNGNITDKGDLRDPAGNISLAFSRDNYRTPMQWSNDSTSGGFSNLTIGGQPWLPVNIDSINVESQENDPDSNLSFVRNLTKLRKNEGSLQYGAIHYTFRDKNIFSFVREHEGNDRILVVANFGNAESGPVDLTKAKYGISIPGKADVVLATESTMQSKDFSLKKFELGAGQGFIAKWAFKRSL